jgi:transketolase
VWVWTHDSVGLGQDGPTHQPVEHYASLRAIPRLWVVRPADANETSVAWRIALEREDGPVALLLSRQTIPVLDREEVASAEGLERGGYVLWDSSKAFGSSGSGDGAARGGNGSEVILIATGAEVPTTLEAGRTLAADGAVVRVVSMPCMELFEAQPPEYRQQVLPREVTARLAVEPGASMSWWKWVGLDGDVLGLDRFGASAPGPIVLEKLGFTADNIAARAKALLERPSLIAS